MEEDENGTPVPSVCRKCFAKHKDIKYINSFIDAVRYADYKGKNGLPVYEWMHEDYKNDYNGYDSYDQGYNGDSYHFGYPEKYDDDKYDYNKYDDGKYNEDKYDYNKYNDNKYNDNKYNDNKYNDNKYNDNKYNNYKPTGDLNDNKYNDNKYNDNKYNDNKYNNYQPTGDLNDNAYTGDLNAYTTEMPYVGGAYYRGLGGDNETSFF